MAKVTISDLLTKSKAIFKKDIFVYHSSYVLSGPLSFDENVGFLIADICDELKESILDYFDKDKCYYIQDVTTGKKLEEGFFIEVNEDMENKDLYNFFNIKAMMHLNHMIKINEWEKLEIPDDHLDEFINGGTFSLSIHGTFETEIPFNRSMIPYMVKDNVNSTYNLNNINIPVIGKANIDVGVFTLRTDAPLMITYVNYIFFILK